LNKSTSTFEKGGAKSTFGKGGAKPYPPWANPPLERL